MNMLHTKTMGAVAILGLLAGTAASADDRHYSRDDYYPSSPQIRLGVDVIWGGYGHAPPRLPVAWYPAYYAPPRYYGYNRAYDRGYDRGYEQGHDRGHRQHGHRPHRGDDCDD
jgi:hypothetical protein